MSPVILLDHQLAGTQFRGLILQGPLGYCANLGVAKSQLLPSMKAIQLECHGGITYRAFGDGEILNANLFWFGWDYSPFDSLDEVDTEHLWTLGEMEQDLIGVAHQLEESMLCIRIAGNARAKCKQFADKV